MQRTAPTSDDHAGADGVVAFVKQLDALVRRRPRKDPRLPTILLVGPHADELVRYYSDRLTTGERRIVPHVLINCPTEDPTPDPAAGNRPHPRTRFLDRMTDQLAVSLPTGARGMRGGRDLGLPRYRTTSRIVGAEPSAGTEAERRRELRDVLYEQAPTGWIASFATGLGKVQLGPVDGDLLARPLVASCRWAFGLRLQVGRRFAWFRDEMAARTGTRRSFLGSGLRLTANDSERFGVDDTIVQRILTLALLRDLQAATRRSLFSPPRRRRVTPFVVQALHVADGSLAHQFLDALATIQSDDVRRHTLLVVATPADDERGPVLAKAPKYSLREAARRLASIAGSGALSEPSIRVDVPEPLDEDWLKIYRVLQPPPATGAVAIPVLAGLVVMAAVAALVVPAVRDDGAPRCPREVGGEMIGVGDGADGCEYFPNADQTASEVDDAMVAAEEAIASENAAVLASGQPYATIVFFAPLTIPPGQGRQGENALNQLRGTALAQQRANDRAVNDPNRVLTRVLLANPGDRFAHGPEVAQQIVDRADVDETIIGVVGISQSRKASRDAVRLLGLDRLPVVAGPVTGDRMVDASAHYYQISPRNKRVAAMLVAFSTQAAIVRDPGSGLVPAEGAVIVMDHSDEYSRNLAYDLHAAFAAELRETRAIVTYPIEDPGAAVPESPVAGAPEPIQVSSSDALAHELCTRLGERGVVFYASRSQQFIGLLQSMHDDSECPERFTVVGGSALTKIVEDPSQPFSQYEGVSLYYAAFASQGLDYSSATDEFMRRYQRAYGEAEIAPDISDAAVAYDAFNALQRTADYALGSDLPISADTSASTLGGKEIGFNGASGFVTLGNDPISGESPRVPPDKPVLVLPAGESNPTNTLACGRYAREDRQVTWGPDGAYDCPTVN